MTDQASPSRPWPFYVSGVLYAVQFRPALNEDVVQSIKGKITKGVGLTGGAAAYIAAIRQGLEQDETVSDLVPSPHGESECRAFLAALLRSLDEHS
jgi:hypothetical protein